MNSIKLLLTLFLVMNFGQSLKANQERYFSPYETFLTLPSCHDNNPEIQVIKSADDWLRINDLNKTIFCVKPADYSTLGRVVLTASGTEDHKRYILLDNGNNTHPSQLSYATLAKVGFELRGANHWVIDRMGYWESKTAYIPTIVNNSDNNVFNRNFFKNVNGGAIVIRPNSDNNTIQNCRLERSDITLHIDRAAIELNNNGQDNVSIKNTKIINNEIINFVDGIQLVKTGNSMQKFINYEGTVIDNNHIHIDSRIYTDCNGSHKEEGQCAYAENAIDLKVGSENIHNPVIISFNKMWGYKKADEVDRKNPSGQSGLSDSGVIVPMHYNVKNVLFKKNTFFNSAFALVIDGPRNGFSAQNIEISDNIFYNIFITAIYARNIHHFLIQNNLFKKLSYGSDGQGKDAYNSFYINDSKDISFSDNIIIDAYRSAAFYVRESAYNGKDSDYYTFHKNLYFNAQYDKGYNAYEKSRATENHDALMRNKNARNPTKYYKNLRFITNVLNGEKKTMMLPKVLKY